ncbi:hypothetical protein HKD37_02G005135 [Glycine soja]
MPPITTQILVISATDEDDVEHATRHDYHEGLWENNEVTCFEFFCCVHRMTTPPPSPTQAEIPFDGTSRKTRQSTQLRRVVVGDKIPILHSSWNNVLETLKNMIWGDILAKFDIPEGDNVKKKGHVNGGNVMEAI